MRYNVFIWAGILIVIVTPLSPWLLAPYLSTKIDGKLDMSTLGTAGDLLGGSTTPLFTLASFLMLIATVLMQKDELKMQREELAATREELKEQNRTLSIQRFENTFFHMISLHNEIVDSITYKPYGGSVQTGRNYFIYAYSMVRDYIQKKNEPTELDNIKVGYDQYFELHNYLVGHYFQNLYRIVRIIDEAEGLKFEDKKTYIGILKAQLSSQELLMLFYNVLSEHGSERFLPLTKKYNLFDNIDEDSLCDPSHLATYKDYEQIIEAKKK